MTNSFGLQARAILLAGVMTATAYSQDKPAYPPSRTESVADELHGQSVADPYRWLEDGDSHEVRQWTDQQNAFTRKFLEALPGRDAIRRRLDELLTIGSLSAPRPVRGRYFYLKREGTQNQPILYVRESSAGADRVLIDVNALDPDGTTALDWWYPSPDGKLLAYGISVGGSEQSTLRVRDVAGGRDRDDVIPQTRACSLAWLPDASGFYYTRYPTPGSVPAGEENYNRRVYFHPLGGDPADDPLVFGEGRPKEDWPNVDLSPNGRWLVVTQQQGWAKTEVYFQDRHAKSPFRPLVEKIDAVFQVEPRDDGAYIRTNYKAPRYKLMKADLDEPDRAHWKEIIPESDDVFERFAIVGGTLAAEFMHNAASRLKLLGVNGQLKSEVSFDGPSTVVGLTGEWDGTELFVAAQSFTAPTVVRRHDLKTGESTVWGRVHADIPFDAFEAKQVVYLSKDGTPVTMFIAGKKGLQLDGNNPTLLYGYGGFNISLTPAFNPSLYLFLERGGVLAIPNLRGGGEYGEAWHQAGMLGRKQNVFDDFLAAAEWLTANRYTSPQRLAIRGGSNGGLLVGAAMTQRPDLFRAVVCQVPLLDMIRYHKFLIARLWIPEYGSADDADAFRWLSAYSPYHRVRDGVDYPATLISTAESDTRVDPLHARKFAARVQAAQASSRPILVRIEGKAGHGAGKPRGKQLDELTDVYSFLFDQLGMKP